MNHGDGAIDVNLSHMASNMFSFSIWHELSRVSIYIQILCRSFAKLGLLVGSLSLVCESLSRSGLVFYLQPATCKSHNRNMKMKGIQNKHWRDYVPKTRNKGRFWKQLGLEQSFQKDCPLHR